jgi:hypothetical protein
VSLWIYLWLAETSQQPISQTTWLKVTPHCNHCNHCELRKHFSFRFTPFLEDFSAAQPFLLQQVNNQLVHDFLPQQNKRLFLFLSQLMDLFVAGRDQSAADQPNNLAEGHPPL